MNSQLSEEKEAIIEKVIAFAKEAHGSQQRKYTPEPYIVHPVRVMNHCRQYTGDVAVLCAAVLHDVLEDTPVTRNDMYVFLSSVMDTETAKRTVDLVVELTDVYVKKDYPKYNRRTRKAMERSRMEKTSPEAQTIKYIDIIDNCKEIAVHDPDFGKVFLRECRTLLEKMDKGDPALYKEAMETITAKQEVLKR